MKSTSVRLSRLGCLSSLAWFALLSLCELPLHYPSAYSAVQCPNWYIDYRVSIGTRSQFYDRGNRIGIQVLYSGVLWPHPARVTRLHHCWGVNEAEILFQASALAGV